MYAVDKGKPAYIVIIIFNILHFTFVCKIQKRLPANKSVYVLNIYVFPA